MLPKYEYKRPAGKLYRVSSKRYKKFFTRQGDWEIAHEVYVDADCAVIQHVPSWWLRTWVGLASPMLYPLTCLLHGYKEANGAFLDVFFTKKRGAFYSDTVCKRNRAEWDKLLKMMERNNMGNIYRVKSVGNDFEYEGVRYMWLFEVMLKILSEYEDINKAPEFYSESHMLAYLEDAHDVKIMEELEDGSLVELEW